MSKRVTDGLLVPIQIRPSLTLSNKPYGIAMYYLAPAHTFMKGKLVPDAHNYAWHHLMNRWYHREKDMFRALRDFSGLNESKWKYVPFKNDYATMPQDKIKLNIVNLPR